MERRRYISYQIKYKKEVCMKNLKYMDAPFTIKIELVEGCNLFCKWCGIRGIRKGPGGYKFLTISLAKKIAKQIKESGWNPRLELAMRGEPTMNPNLLEIIHILKEENKFIPIMITSNGGGLLKNNNITKNISSLFEAGLNVLALDDYKYSKIIPKIKNEYKGNIPITTFPEESPYKKRKYNEKIIIIIPDIGQYTKLSTRTLSNHCGCAFPLNFSKKDSLCARPFRELAIRYDGKVPLCCNDWRGTYICGDITKNNIVEIWNNKNFDAVRRVLFFNKRTFPPCLGCDSISYRLGFLPDKMGKKKKEIENPDEECFTTIKNILKESPLNKIVKRPWEILFKNTQQRRKIK
jgi:organic radical activating enzyme